MELQGKYVDTQPHSSNVDRVNSGASVLVTLNPERHTCLTTSAPKEHLKLGKLSGLNEPSVT